MTLMVDRSKLSRFSLHFLCVCFVVVGISRTTEAGLVGSTFDWARTFDGTTYEGATNVLVQDGGAPEVVSTGYTFDVRDTSIVMNSNGVAFSPFGEHLIEFTNLHVVDRPLARITGATYELITPTVRNFGQEYISFTDDSLTLDVGGTVNEFGQVFNSGFGNGSSFVINLQFEGLFDPSNASFASDSDIDRLTIDFGTLGLGSGPAVLPFSITNLSGPGPNAPLEFLSAFFSSGNTAFSTNLSSFPDLDEGGTRQFLATMNTDTVGTYSSRYNIFFNDETGNFQFLRLTLNGTVEQSAVPEPTSLALLATGAFGLFGYGWRRKRKQAA